MDFKLHNGQDGLSKAGCTRHDRQLNTYDWLADIPGNQQESELVEVQFKNTRKGYYRNTYGIPLEKGDIVAVESNPGHDIGQVTLTGRLVPLQMKKANIRKEEDIRRIYRKAKQVDLEKYEEAKAREHDTMIRARQIALDLNLQMKIGDVEYQGDGNKAIFYYIADERVDFRQLIKVLADAFHVRIEMKQIGVRQEAGRIGGIGPCGRELCCSTWMTAFVSVSTNAARLQDISLNPQKLAGQCAKLKCCMNYEIDSYVESQRRLPSREIQLETKDALYYFFKADILANQITYSTDKGFLANAVTISSRRAFEVISMNKKGIRPDSLETETGAQNGTGYGQDLLEQESLTRFDAKAKNRDGKKHRGDRQKGRTGQEAARERQAGGQSPKPGTRPRNPDRERKDQAAGGRERPERPRPERNRDRGQQPPQGASTEPSRPPRRREARPGRPPRDGRKENGQGARSGAPSNTAEGSAKGPVTQE